jgi:hypothetical protein
MDGLFLLTGVTSAVLLNVSGFRLLDSDAYDCITQLRLWLISWGVYVYQLVVLKQGVLLAVKLVTSKARSG